MINLQPNKVIEKLAKHNGKKAYFFEFKGNNGDKLIAMGARNILNKSGLQITEDITKAELIVANGGARIERWNNDGSNILQRLLEEHPQIPVIFLPSTYEFGDDSLLCTLNSRPGPVTLFAREQNSIKRLQVSYSNSNIEILLDHDAAFALDDSDFVKELRLKSAPRHILIVERADLEGVTGHSLIEYGPAWKKYIPTSLKCHAKRYLTQKHSAKTPLALEIDTWLNENNSDWAKLPRSTLDISRPDLYSFDGFSKMVSQSAAIFSTRLHVCILGALLEKPTYVVAGKSSLGKISGVYEQSMSKLQHVHLWK